jgi:hypothetical protein
MNQIFRGLIKLQSLGSVILSELRKKNLFHVDFSTSHPRLVICLALIRSGNPRKKNAAVACLVLHLGLSDTSSVSLTVSRWWDAARGRSGELLQEKQWQSHMYVVRDGQVQCTTTNTIWIRQVTWPRGCCQIKIAISSQVATTIDKTDGRLCSLTSIRSGSVNPHKREIGGDLFHIYCSVELFPSIPSNSPQFPLNRTRSQGVSWWRSKRQTWLHARRRCLDRLPRAAANFGWGAVTVPALRRKARTTSNVCGARTFVRPARELSSPLIWRTKYTAV